MTNHVLNTI